METTAFYGRVEERATLADESDARNATHAVLSALGERLDETRSQRLSGDLPDELGGHLTDGASGRRVSYDDYLDRVQDRTDHAEIGNPERLSRAVVETLLEAIDDDEAEALYDRLEAFDYDSILPDEAA